MSKVFVTDYFEELSVEESVLGKEVSLVKNSEVEVLMVWHQHVDGAYLDQFPNLKGVQRYGVGYDGLDLVAIKERGLIACNNPDYGTDEVSDTTIAMIMNISRGILRYNQLSKSLYNDWQENVLPGIKRSNKTTVGIIGCGRIGGSVALKCKAIGFNVIFYDKYKDRGYEKMLGVERVESIDELLSRSNIVSVNSPLTAETRGMIDQKFINSMQKGSSLVLTARGGIIEDIDIFYDALKSNHLVNVALDVIPQEPPMPGKLIDAWRNSESWLNDRLIINNHTSYFSDESYYEIRHKAALNAKRILEGKEVYNIL